MSESALEHRRALAAQGRYPLYQNDELVATIDEDLRLRDLTGKFIPRDRDERRALLASCLVVSYGYEGGNGGLLTDG